MRTHGFGERVVVPVDDIYEIFHRAAPRRLGIERLFKTAVYELAWNV